MATEKKTTRIVATLDVPNEIYEKLEKKAEEKGVDVGQVIADLIEENEDLKLPAVTYEQVQIMVPERVMDFLRKTEANPKEWIEYTVTDNVRAHLESLTGDDFVEQFELGLVFREVLGDKRYK